MTRAARWITTAAAVLISSFAHRAMAEDLRKLVTISTPEKISTISVCGTTGLVAGAIATGAGAFAAGMISCCPGDSVRGPL